MPTSTLRDLGRHMVWADAEQWRALDAHAGALEDTALRTRLHHVHLVQHFFYFAVSGEGPFALTSAADFPTAAALRAYGRERSSMLAALIEGAGAELLARPITIPHFQNPPLIISAQEALTQVVMHTQWHRGQNSARLRELGAEPPTIDYIIWLWRGRPPANW